MLLFAFQPVDCQSATEHLAEIMRCVGRYFDNKACFSNNDKGAPRFVNAHLARYRAVPALGASTKHFRAWAQLL